MGLKEKYKLEFLIDIKQILDIINQEAQMKGNG